ncbi:MAG: aminotransferase class IV, partial [Chloroflexaceae bacterium]|nr:aminotransferase class IV [Chloroflexaceae bacterium]
SGHPFNPLAGPLRSPARGVYETLGWNLPHWPQLQQGAQALLSWYPVLRVTIFPDGREWIAGRPLPAELSHWQQQGICAWLAPPQNRSLPTHKTGNYLLPWLAKQQAGDRGAQEAILCDPQGHWLETSTGNLWGWQGGCWYTPPVTAQALPGIARDRLLSWLRQQGIKVKERPWPGDWVQSLDFLAYSNCVMEVIPIHRVICPWGQLTYKGMTSPAGN